MDKAFDLGLWAQNLGWAEAGVTGPDIHADSLEKFKAWLQNYKGPGLQYLERRKQERLSPRDYFPALKSILCFGLYYYPGNATGDLKVSNYSWGEDYHQSLKTKLEATAQELQKILGEFSYRICVDTAPVLEKILAVQAGLGWQGKNTLLLNKTHGSYLFLGEIFTDLDLHLFSPSLSQTNHCGKCTRCIDACPTDALEPFILKADQCISYWTLEHKGDFTPQTPHWENWLAGCDICQEVCPWNKDLIPIPEATPFQISAKDIQSNKIQELVKDRALSYVPPSAWERNLRHLWPKS